MAVFLKTRVLCIVVLVTGRVVPDISKEHRAFFFKSQVVQVHPRRIFLNCLALKMKALCPFTASVTTHTITHHIPEIKNPEHSVSPYSQIDLTFSTHRD
jgi:hypothetical protein